MNNEKSLFDQIVDMELQALAKYCDYNNVEIRDYVNPDVMGEEEYQKYLQLFSQHFNECFECGEKVCDEDCQYQIRKAQTND